MGDESTDEASLILYPGTPQKGQEHAAACRARRDIALNILTSAPKGLTGSSLGMAQPLACAGLNVRVFDDRVCDAAFKWNRAHATVLAHVIAHEIGHVLLRTNAHSPRGLMAGVWGDHEYQFMARNLLRFTRDESTSMRITLSGDGCGGSEGNGPLEPLQHSVTLR